MWTDVDRNIYETLCEASENFARMLFRIKGIRFCLMLLMFLLWNNLSSHLPTPKRARYSDSGPRVSPMVRTGYLHLFSQGGHATPGGWGRRKSSMILKIYG